MRRLRITPRQLSSTASALAALLPLVYLALGYLRARPFVDDVDALVSAGDDWLVYKTFAVSVVRGGLSIPALSTTYAVLPHGFLYIYFLAAVFAVLGVNAAYVYVVQSLILGVSVSLTWVAFRKKLSAASGLMLLASLAVWAYVDVFRAITFRLLSENLYFLLFPPMFIFLLRSYERTDHRVRDALLAGLFLGLILLTRPSMVMSVALMMAVAWIAGLTGRVDLRMPMLLSAGVMVGASGVAIRNLAATGHLSFDIVSDTTDWVRLWELSPPMLLLALVKRTLFVFGFTQLMRSAFRPRPHWMLLWVTSAAYPVLAFVTQRRMELWELCLYLYVVGYVVPVVLVADVSSYGGRMVVVVLPIAMVLAFRTVDLLTGMKNEAVRV